MRLNYFVRFRSVSSPATVTDSALACQVKSGLLLFCLVWCRACTGSQGVRTRSLLGCGATLRIPQPSAKLLACSFCLITGISSQMVPTPYAYLVGCPAGTGCVFFHLAVIVAWMEHKWNCYISVFWFSNISSVYTEVELNSWTSLSALISVTTFCARFMV